MVDHLGSIREVTSDSATLVARYAFEPWGDRSLVDGADITNVGFTGHGYHAASNTFLTRYRAYDASMGRWISADPIGLWGGPNLYSYVSNRPATAIDPEGLFIMVLGAPVVIDGAIVTGAAILTLITILTIAPPKWPPPPLPPLTETTAVPWCPTPMQTPKPPGLGCRALFEVLLAGCAKRPTMTGRVACRALAVGWLVTCLGNPD
jgi:RHS repeat-associated protein